MGNAQTMPQLATNLPGAPLIASPNSAAYDLLGIFSQGVIEVRHSGQDHPQHVVPVFERTTVPKDFVFGTHLRLAACGLEMQAGVSVPKGTRVIYDHRTCR